MDTPGQEEATMTRPMEGVTVLDFTFMMAGPYCTRMMADLGARVIKVEPLEGDHMRTGVPRRDGHSAYFAHLNAGKQSILLDLKQPQGRDTALALAAKADVVIENFRPGVMDRLGLSYAAVAARSPGIIYCSISGYGQEGAYAQRPSFAPVVHAASGMDLAVMQHQQSDLPPTTSIFTADVLAGMYSLIAIQSALAVRARTGRGQRLDVTLFESMFNLMPFEVQEAQFPLSSTRAMYKPIRARDGFLMVVIITPGNFESLCEVLQRPDLRSDPRFAQSPSRAIHRAELMQEVERWTLQRSAEECEELLSRAGVPCTRYRTVRENLSHPVLTSRESFADVEDGAGIVRVPNLPYRVDGTRPRVGRSVPEPGEHTAEVLRELAGVDAQRLRQLAEAGVTRP